MTTAHGLPLCDVVYHYDPCGSVVFLDGTHVGGRRSYYPHEVRITRLNQESRR